MSGSATPPTRDADRLAAPTEWLWVAGGGALGAVARSAVGEQVEVAFGAAWIATATVDVLGAFSLGVVLAGLERHRPRPQLRAFLAVGFLGAFTTFSSLVAESPPAAFADVRLPAALASGVHVALSILFGIGAFVVGDRTTRSMALALADSAPGARPRS